MGFDVFTVELQSNAPVYFSGQHIQGHVRAVASSEVSCRGITVLMRGKGKVEWTEHRNKRTYTYSSKEEYGAQTLTVWNGASTNNKFQPGNHTFPFMFMIPHGCPSSFEVSHGKVHYEVKVTADIPWGLDEVEKAYFNVHAMYDLNLDEQAILPLRIEKEDHAGCCCCKQGPIEFQVSAERTGYVPGEKMFLSGTIWNHTVTPVKYTEAKIKQSVLLKATTKTRTEVTTVQRVYRPSIRAGGKDVWNRIPLTIPAVAPSLLRFCNNIDVSYELQVLAKLGSCKSAVASTTIIIGSVPLRGTLPSNIQPIDVGMGGQQSFANYNMGPAPSMPTAPLAQFGVSDAPPPYPETAPPSYDDYKRTTGPYDDDEGGFAPRPHEKGYGNF